MVAAALQTEGVDEAKQGRVTAALQSHLSVAIADATAKAANLAARARSNKKLVAEHSVQIAVANALQAAAVTPASAKAA